ncbi:hypothetical protein EYZ11_013284 [Aspergillus tanneri]|uniref:BZIP domain-containing protein n=1 Tax=Aspergillus tanneri TaxID=1220188 RepID=A0A4S3IY17_9EURO|nr:uncharacterized protein ATNIH1004_004866 [Aspergillus tanneri]KAA8648976.1 hypothetical protein ATNIH1004_004866 [Aspergillus tanneri]THC87270.1 hypothetical protein EYZ11_013284 [Aspergillus tanneri]
MSQISSVSTPLADDALRAEPRPVFDKKRPHVADESSVEGRDPLRPRPLSWNPSAPVEPSLKSTQLRPIGVQSILNPPAKAVSTAAAPAETIREGLGEPGPSHTRHPSSPTVHLPSPSIHARRLSASPGMRNHQTSTPLSPSARFVTAGAGHPGRAGASQSPLAHESRPSMYTSTPGSPLPFESAPGQTSSLSTHQQPGAPISIHSTPTFHSRRTSAVPTPTPSSQETSPTTPISAFSQFGRSSPSLTGVPKPPHAPPFSTSSPFTTVDPVTRLPSAVAGVRHTSDEAATIGMPQPDNAPLPGMIPCILDLKSGSSSQAEKRKANSDASRRFRNRKRNEMQMEQKINAQQEEIRKQAESLQRQCQEIRVLVQERDHYRSERDFYRDHVSRLAPSSQLPPRPTSPRTFRSSVENPTSDRDHTSTWRGMDMMARVGDAPAGSHPGASNPPRISSAARTPGNWSSASSQYSTTTVNHTERGVLADEHQTKSLAQYPGAWARP